MKTNSQGTRSIRTLLIKPFQQVRFGIYILATTIVFLAVTAALFIHTFNEQYRHVLGVFHVVDPQLRWEFITDQVFYANLTRLVVLFLVFVIVMFFTVFKLTHRYYGPLVAINRYLDKLNAGEYNTSLALRRSDEFHDIAAKLNRLASRLRDDKEP